MAERPQSIRALEAALVSATVAEQHSLFYGRPCVVVQLDAPRATQDPLFPVRCPVIGIGREADAPDVVDVVVATDAEADHVAVAIEANPVASMVLVQLLRHNERVDTMNGLFAESLAYSSLQHGAEFESWLNSRTPKPPPEEPDQPVLLVRREDDELRLTLNRPDKRNAYSAAIRDALCEALALLADDASIRRAVLDGAGACFSAGGDLDEFGEARDAGRAHASRVTRSAGALMNRLRDRVEVRLHGACIGAGIELPAFAGRVVARRDAFFQLPEVGFGLVPGAGGTVSILPRIGRRRLAHMALTGDRVDAATALEWGLVDELVDGVPE